MQGACAQLYNSCLHLVFTLQEKMFSKNVHPKLLKYFDVLSDTRWQHSATAVKLKPFKDIPGPPGI